MSDTTESLELCRIGPFKSWKVVGLSIVAFAEREQPGWRTRVRGSEGIRVDSIVAE